MTPKSQKWMQLPRNIAIGHGAIADTARMCTELKLGKHAIIVTGRTTRAIAGESVSDILASDGFQTDIAIVTNADQANIDATVKTARDASFLVGVGGGTVIDVAKLASTLLDIPFLSVPTAAAHDGIASMRASIARDGDTVSVPAQAPLGIIADTEIIARAPYRSLASGCGDLISNYTAILDWQLAHRLRNTPYSEYAATLSRMTAQIVMDRAETIKPELEESARLVIKALVSSGVAMSIAGSSMPASGSEHKFSHALDRLAPKPAMHGEQCGVGTIMMMYLHGGNWQRIRDALRTIGAPTTACELGIPDRCVVDALVHAARVRPERYTILGAGLTRDAAENVARITGVIGVC
ncbi:MAG: NAD(P)-dependent glycerol-1-phosphate dehydrogenase [Methanosarcinales archaeon]|nr:NAD(P)-dependent glycerol-1-phosphate dehydrogenase [Methanosarcinales archaeon]